MKRFSLLFLLLSFFFKPHAQTEPSSDGLRWYTDVLKAQQASEESKKPIFAFFTGSDWCGWCHKIEREVFAKQKFKDWANNKVILLELDFPRFKRLEPALAQQNAELQRTFQVTGFPTIWIFFLEKDNTNGKLRISALGSLGYPQRPVPGQEELTFLSEANHVLSNPPMK